MSQAKFPLIGRNELFNYTSKSQSKIVKAYKTLICQAVKLFRAGITYKQAREISEGIFMFEAELAKRTIPAEDRRDPLARYKNATIAALIQRFPEIEWLRLFNKKFSPANITLTKDEPIILWVDEYFKKTVPFLETANLRNVYNFIVWRFIIGTGRIASRKLDDLMFEFLSVYEGYKKPWKVWKKCVSRVSELLTFAVGRLYIDFKFSVAAKSSIDHLVDAVNDTMVHILKEIKWMDDATRHEALRKLRKMSRKIAYPERIRNDTYLNEFYSKVPVIQENSSFVKFFYRVSQIDNIYTLQSLREPYNSSEEWGNGPALVNAFYSPEDNHIRFPAGILQAPFFEHGVPSYINMGSIGVVIGHELSHAFDDLAAVIHRLNTHSAIIPVRRHNMRWDADPDSQALQRLRKMSRKIAYPERIRNDTYLDEFYSKVPVIQENSSFVKFFYRVSQIDNIYTLQSLREPYNSSEEWGNGPALVNAFYSPEDNHIRFPAGILQAPFFEHGVPSYINMGSIGVVIGHELSHAFDDLGSQYDADGLLNNWWTPETRKQFLKRADCFVQQYGNISLDGGKLQLNGKNTLGENIADNLAMKAAYMALQRLDMNHVKLPGLENFTSEQLFFISNAIIFCVNMRPEALKDQVLYDPHSPYKYRVNIPMSNVKEFSKAFGCKPSSHIHNKKKCTMW
ncbi:putative neprilysin [Ixodes scapularis]